MYEKIISERIAALRTQKNVSAREMSLALGQNESYINRIENGHALPSMLCFFYICEYLNVTPGEFFDIDNTHPQKLKDIYKYLLSLDEIQLDTIISFSENMKHLLTEMSPKNKANNKKPTN